MIEQIVIINLESIDPLSSSPSPLLKRTSEETLRMKEELSPSLLVPLHPGPTPRLCKIKRSKISHFGFKGGKKSKLTFSEMQRVNKRSNQVFKHLQQLLLYNKIHF